MHNYSRLSFCSCICGWRVDFGS